ncbi:uncharacterized protein SCHCODRAFT_01111076 [Schizophyllum commune H4-8]|uniref:Uncharacterized protein n=1 Tax=Schizophyllum commune (strain H4-8 / FGSC 9210) TaxID=578458 RepID=D8PYA1_SCHCM|nr:uncharacterized protein SCHCODRAFT_01111076 [Schizophyllum commune H4-8]KAI5897240.1 hypothetical protein SCHCODRAFT_01111076 [Schizophyllum commune H4-8]
MTARRPYGGTVRKLLMAIDIGTTFSGVSYSILDPGQVPQVFGVNRFPAQEHAGGDSKIPTIILYDTKGNIRAVGAETLEEETILRAADEGWTRSEWFKLHLRPRASDPRQELSTLPPLPPNKTVVDVFSDFLAYMFKCARDYIQETHPGGAQLWSSVAENIDFVLTHPNGWEGSQQSLMRLSAIQAKLVPDSDSGRARVSFVTEGEASLHFCLSKGLISEGVKADNGLIIVDAGGGTIDLSAYTRQKGGQKVSYVESAPAQCLFKGAIMVTRNAQTYIKDRLKGSRYFDRAADIADTFDKTTKQTFKNAKTPAYVKFGGMGDSDTAYNIRGGRLVIAGADMAKFFQPSVSAIAQAVLRQREEAKLTAPSIFLVGGFAASTYLYAQLRESLSQLGMDVCRPDSHINKAVADGGVLYVLDHRVTARVAKFTYGVCGSQRYQQSIPDHARRELTSLSFRLLIRLQGTLVTETQEFRRSFYQSFTNPMDAKSVECRIYVYRGPGLSQNYQWRDVEPESYARLCTVQADASRVMQNLPLTYGNKGRAYYHFDHENILRFGLTELQAQMCWIEKVRFVPVLASDECSSSSSLSLAVRG